MLRSCLASAVRYARARPSCPQSPGHPALSRESTGCRSSFLGDDKDDTVFVVTQLWASRIRKGERRHQ